MSVPQSDTSQSSDAIYSLAKELNSVFQTKESYRKLLGRASNEADAQKLLDSFQRLLDQHDLERRLRRNLIVATQRLSKRSGLYPACHELKDVEQLGKYPVTSGGFADIYKGMLQGKVVCMKVIRLYETSQIEHVLKKFSNEVLLWRQLLHPNILTIYGLYKFQDRLAMVMPWLENGDLTKYLNNHPDAPRLLLIKDVADGLSYLHTQPVIHGDLKGKNILIDDSGRARLADFGTSIVSDPQILAWTTQSRDTSQGGTVRWQAPELFAVGDGENEDEPLKTTASDVYAFGCVCLEIFTNQIPFAEISNDFNVMLRVQNGRQPARPPKSSLCWISWGLTEEIWSFVKGCWAKNPDDRPSADKITDFFNVSHIQDFRRSPETDWISRATFRNKVNKPVNVIGVEELQRMLTVTRIHPPPRHVARASTIYNGRSPPPQGRKSQAASTLRSNTPPVGSGSVWDFMHAPKTDAYKYATPTPTASVITPRSQYPSNFGNSASKPLNSQAKPYSPKASPPSPTPSTVSLDPTQGEDGRWWT